MGYSEALDWWEEWQLRILTLSSLFLQYFLFIAAALRKHSVPFWFRSLTWLAYLGSDALAIYALATLFNRHQKEGWVSTHLSTASLEVLWAPIMLVHLGGQDGITAYNIEDNELWMRHVVSALSQVVVSIYVFRNSWSGDMRLLQSAILIFVPGILKCVEKPLSLRRASIMSVVKKARKKDAAGCSKSQETGAINSLESYVEQAAKCSKSETNCTMNGDDEKEMKKKIKKVVEDSDKLFVDMAYPYSIRYTSLNYFLHHKEDVHGLVRAGLSKTFNRFYTKSQTDNFLPGVFLRFVEEYLIFAAIGLFHHSHLEDYNATDVKVTYILLCGTAVLEVIMANTFKLMKFFFGYADTVWPEQISQYSLIGYLAKNKEHRWKAHLADKMEYCKDYLDQLWCKKPDCKSTSAITMLAHDHITKRWEQGMDGADLTGSYKALNEKRGQWTLDRLESTTGLKWTKRSILRPFDESILLWHLVTDLCFYKEMDTSVNPVNPEAAGHCRVISNYMVYLLFINPEMLITGARSSLFIAAYNELKALKLSDTARNVPTKWWACCSSNEEYERELAENIMKTKVHSPCFVHDACIIAEELTKNWTKRDNMWTAIRDIWVEMLCFSAGRCRGYLHAKNLSKGGEYLSYVWLLLSHMGMETLSERIQLTELQEEGDKGTSNMTSVVTTITGDDSA